LGVLKPAGDGAAADTQYAGDGRGLLAGAHGFDCPAAAAF
jgi:hypothetical protein